MLEIPKSRPSYCGSWASRSPPRNLTSQILDERVIESIPWIQTYGVGKVFGAQETQIRSNHVIPHRRATLDIRRVGIVPRIDYQFILPSCHGRNKVPIKSPTGGGP